MLHPFGNHPTLSKGIRHHFPMYDNRSDSYLRNLVRDPDGNENHGVFDSGSSSTYYDASGKVQACQDWSSGSGRPYAQIERWAGELFMFGIPVSIGQWIYLPSGGSGYRQIFGNVNDLFKGLFLLIDTANTTIGSYYGYRYDNSNRRVLQTKPLPEDEWLYLMFTYDGNTANPTAGMHSYVNGLPHDYATDSNGLTIDFTGSEEPFYFSKATCSAFDDFEGKQSDVTIWDWCLGPHEAAAAFNMYQGRPIVPTENSLFGNSPRLGACTMEWLCDEEEANTTVNDTTGLFNGVATANTEDITSGTPSPIGSGSFLLFSDYVIIDEIAQYITDEIPLTVELWVYSNDANKAYFGEISSGAGLCLFSDASSQPYLILATSSGNYVNRASSTALSSGVWNQIVFSLPGTGGIDCLESARLWTNGDPASTSSTIGSPTTISISNCYLGHTTDGGSAESMAVVRVWIGTVLTDAEVKYLYNGRNARASGL
jgi:hypothetical protein